MSGIVLSASVRQNLLSLQSTADLLATTQNRLATGKKVNTALDNPTNFFTAQSLDSRASDINNLLDGIGNGVQVLQAANTGITSLQKLVDTAKSIANQALQTTVGYSTKSNVSATIAGATATDLRGTTTYTSATATCNVLFSGAAGGTTRGRRRHDARRHLRSAGRHCRRRRCRHRGQPCLRPDPGRCAQRHDHRGQRRADRRRHPDRQRQDHHLQVGLGARRRRRLRPAPASAATSSPTATATPPSISARRHPDGDGAGSGERHRPRQRRPEGRQSPPALRRSPTPSGTNAAIAAGVLTLHDRHRCRSQHHRQGRPAEGARPDRVGRRRRRHGHPAAHDHDCGSLGTLIQDGSTLNVNGKTITFKNARGSAGCERRRPAPASAATSSPTATATRRSICRARTIADTLKAIDLATGVQTATHRQRCGNGRPSPPARSRRRSSQRRAADLDRHERRPVDHRHRQRALGARPHRQHRNRHQLHRGPHRGAGSLSGKTLTFTSFNGGTAVNVTFGDGTNGTVKTLDQLNAALLANNLTATVDSDRQADDHHHQRLCFVDPRFGRCQAVRSAAR